MAFLKSISYTEHDIKLARFAKALGHPARIVIMRHLANTKKCSCCFSDLSNMLPIANSTISQHLTELKNAGLIIGQIEPPYVKYCINWENWLLAKNMFNDFINLE